MSYWRDTLLGDVKQANVILSEAKELRHRLCHAGCGYRLVQKILRSAQNDTALLRMTGAGVIRLPQWRPQAAATLKSALITLFSIK